MNVEDIVSETPEGTVEIADRPRHIRCAQVRAEVARQVLVEAGFTRANEMTEVELCRVHRRLARSAFIRNPIPRNELAAWATRRTRARITHPGKRLRA